MKIPRYNLPPSPGSVGDGAPRAAVLREFSRRLHAAMLNHNPRLNQTDLGNKAGINRDRINRYVNGHELPSAENLYKVAAALGVRPDELMPMEIANSGKDQPPAPFALRSVGNGRTWVEVNREMPDAFAYRIAAVLGELAASEGAS